MNNLERLLEYDYDELAILNFTNNIKEKTNEKKIILTSKSSYIWAVTISYLVEKIPTLSDKDIQTALKRSFNQNKDRLTNHYYNSFEYDDLLDISSFYYIHKSFLACFDIDIMDAANEIIKRVQKAYSSLIEKEIIEDPFFIDVHGASLAVVGFIPTSFTKITKKGGESYLKIEALFYKIEIEKSNVQTKIEIQLKLWKFLNKFKKILIQSMETLHEENE